MESKPLNVRFSKHTDTKWNVYQTGVLGGYLGSIWNDGTCLLCGNKTMTAAELRQIADEMDRLEVATREGGHG